ncbi:MAG: DNA polymerase III subunit delta [Pseudomonadota bacterium]
MSVQRSSARKSLDLETGLERVYLLYGDEALLIRGAIDRIAEAALAGGPAAFNRVEGNAGSDGAVPGLLAQAQTPPMMGPRRLVVVRELENASPGDLEALMAYVGNPCPSSVVVMVGVKLPPATGGVDLGQRLRNAVAKAGQAVKFATADQNPRAFAQQRAQEGGCELGFREAELLVAVVGPDLGQLAGEVDKLVAFVGGQGRIQASDVEEVCSVLAETAVFDLTDAIVRGEAGRALSIVDRLLAEENAPARILPLIIWQVRQLVLIQDCLRRGVNPYDEGIRMPSAKLAAIRQSLQRHPIRVDRILDLLAGSMHTSRTSRADERRVLEALVLRLAGVADQV